MTVPSLVGILYRACRYALQRGGVLTLPTDSGRYTDRRMAIGRDVRPAYAPAPALLNRNRNENDSYLRMRTVRIWGVAPCDGRGIWDLADTLWNGGK